MKNSKYKTDAKPLDRSEIEEGDIVAFDTEYGRGVALMKDGNWYHSSYNLVERNRLFVLDSMPADIQLFPPTKEDILLAIEHLQGELVEEEGSPIPMEDDFWSMCLGRPLNEIKDAVNDMYNIYYAITDRWKKKLKQETEHSVWLQEQMQNLTAEIKEKDKKIAQLETQLNEMSKLSAGVAKKSSQDDVLKAIRTYLNISKRKTLSKREAAKTVLMDLFTSTRLDLPDDIKELLTYLDDEQPEAKVVNVQGNYNDIHDNGTVNNKE